MDPSSLRHRNFFLRTFIILLIDKYRGGRRVPLKFNGQPAAKPNSTAPLTYTQITRSYAFSFAFYRVT
jgi:hypothetical protein